jgi:hypothetical protein
MPAEEEDDPALELPVLQQKETLETVNAKGAVTRTLVRPTPDIAARLPLPSTGHERQWLSPLCCRL